MKKVVKKIYNTIVELFVNMGKDNVSEYTAQCAYYTMLSFIPFIILLMTMIQYTGLQQQTIINVIEKIIPSTMNGMVINIVQEVYSKSIGTISISIIFTLWSAGKSLYALTRGFQSIYGVKGKKETNYFYLRFKAILQTIVFIVLITVSLTLLVFGDSLISIIQENFGGLPNFGLMYNIITKLIYILATFLAFLFLYKFMPRHKVAYKNQALGAAFGAIALNVLSFAFSVYLDVFKGFSITYGSLTTLILIMMWIYSCFYTIFLGAEINKLYNQKKMNIKEDVE